MNRSQEVSEVILGPEDDFGLKVKPSSGSVSHDFNDFAITQCSIGRERHSGVSSAADRSGQRESCIEIVSDVEVVPWFEVESQFQCNQRS